MGLSSELKQRHTHPASIVLNAPSRGMSVIQGPKRPLCAPHRPSQPFYNRPHGHRLLNPLPNRQYPPLLPLLKPPFSPPPPQARSCPPSLRPRVVPTSTPTLPVHFADVADPPPLSAVGGSASLMNGGPGHT